MPAVAADAPFWTEAVAAPTDDDDDVATSAEDDDEGTLCSRVVAEACMDKWMCRDSAEKQLKRMR